MTGAALDLERAYSAELLRAIGVLVVLSSTCEHFLAAQLTRLICHPGPFDPLVVLSVQRADLSVRLRQIATTAQFRLAKERSADVEGLCERIREVYGRRNDIAHLIAQPGPGGDSVILQAMKLRGDNLDNPKPYTVKQILGFAQTLQRLMLELDAAITAGGLQQIPWDLRDRKP